MFDRSILPAEIAPRGKAYLGIAQATLTSIFNRIPQTEDQFKRLEQSINERLAGDSKIEKGATFYDGEMFHLSDKIVDCLIQLKDCQPVTDTLTHAVKSSNVGMECKPVGYALFLLEHDHVGATKARLEQAASNISNAHRTAIESLLVFFEQSTVAKVTAQASVPNRFEADQIKIFEEYHRSRAALLAYARFIVEKDSIAVETIAEHYEIGPVRDQYTLAKIIERLFPSSEEKDESRRVPRAFEELLKLAKNHKEKLKKFQTETIRAIRNVAICLSFPDELCKQACKEKLEHRPIRIPTDQIEWAKLFIGRVLGTIARSENAPQIKKNRSILERLNSDGESMIDVPIDSLIPAMPEMVHPPRDSGPNSVIFLSDLCMGIAKNLQVECKKEELLEFFERWNGTLPSIQCDAIDTLQRQFEIWKILEAHLLVMVPERRPQFEMAKIRKLFDSIQILEVRTGEHNDIVNLRAQIRYFDDMTDQDTQP